MYRFRKGKVVEASIIGASAVLAATFAGVLMCDGYAGYVKLSNKYPSVILAHCWAHVRREFVETEIFQLESVRAGNAIDGPAIVEHSATTFAIPPGRRATLDAHHIFHLTNMEGSANGDH